MSQVPQASRPFTTRAQRVLELAERSAAALNHEYIGAEHILLGLVEEKTGIAAQILFGRGVTSEHVLEELRRIQAQP